MLFEANKAGIRVLAVDTQENRDHFARYGSFDSSETVMDTRLAMDAVISRNIKHLDDGQKGIVLYGKAHTYNPGSGANNIEINGTSYQYYQSPHGGINARLRDMGIETTILDIQESKENAGTVQKADGYNADNYYLTTSTQSQNPDQTFISQRFKVHMNRLALIIEEQSIYEENAGNMDVAQSQTELANQIRNLGNTLDDPDFRKLPQEVQIEKFSEQMASVTDSIYALDNLDDEFLTKAAVSNFQTHLIPSNEQTIEQKAQGIIQDNSSYNSAASQHLWKKEGAALAGGRQLADEDFPKDLSTLDRMRLNSGSFSNQQETTQPADPSANIDQKISVSTAAMAL